MNNFSVDELVSTSKSQYKRGGMVPIDSFLEGDVLLNCNTH